MRIHDVKRIDHSCFWFGDNLDILSHSRRGSTLPSSGFGCIAPNGRHSDGKANGSCVDHSVTQLALEHVLGMLLELCEIVSRKLAGIKLVVASCNERLWIRVVDSQE